MKRLHINFIFIILLLGTLLLMGCNKIHFGAYNASKDDGNPTVTSAPDNGNKSIITEAADPTGSAEATTTEGVTPTHAAIQPIAYKDLPVYTVNADTGDLEPVTAVITEGTEITPQLIVDTVVKSLADDQSINVGIDQVSQDNDTVIVSFKKDTPPSADTGSGYEAAILDAFAQSLMDNLNVKVIFRIEGKAYVSGTFEFGIDDVYTGDN